MTATLARWLKKLNPWSKRAASVPPPVETFAEPEIQFEELSEPEFEFGDPMLFGSSGAGVWGANVWGANVWGANVWGSGAVAASGDRGVIAPALKPTLRPVLGGCL